MLACKKIKIHGIQYFCMQNLHDYSQILGDRISRENDFVWKKKKEWGRVGVWRGTLSHLF